LLALAGEAQPRTLFDAGRDGHLERALLLDPPLAAAALAGVGDHRAAAAALRAGAGDGEEALREAHLADAAAGVAGGGRAGARAAAALALLADLEARYLQRVGGAEGGLLERQLEVVAQIGPRRAAPAAAPPPAAEQVAEAEEIAEHVGEVAEGLRVKAGEATLRAQPAVAEAVVARPLVGVGEHRVSLGRLLEALLGLAVAGVAVGVVLRRELAVRLLDLGSGGGALDAEDFVVIALGHGRWHRVPTRNR